MYKILILGAGKIGATVAAFLHQTGDYEVHLSDLHFNNPDAAMVIHAYPTMVTAIVNVTDSEALNQYLKAQQIQAVMSSLPFFLNFNVATAAKLNDIHYFDLTEDNAVAQTIKNLANNSKTAFVPQCGLAPGFVSIVAHHLMQQFSHLESAYLRVGALPQATNNALHYAITWSIDGLINEYLNSCYAIIDGKQEWLPALEDIESLQFDGCYYEAFNTSGGLGSLAYSYADKISTLNYKTIRYIGHCEKIRFLMNELKLKNDRDTLKRILEHAIPRTYKDVVLIYVLVSGYQDGALLSKHYLKKIYPQKIAGIEWSAIQIATAAGACAIVDLVLQHPEKYQGFVLQEQFNFEKFLNNRFGIYFA